MPELPDIVAYLEALESRVMGQRLTGVRVSSPSVLRTFDPPYDAAVGQPVTGLRRIGKRLVLGFPDDLFMVIHLMVAGRLRWTDPGKPIPKKVGLLALDFEDGTLLLVEQGTKKRAGLWVLRGEDALAEEDRGGIEPLEMSVEDMKAALQKENRTLKRALTDPRLFSGIGNAYSDEILWESQLSPVKRTGQCRCEQIGRLHAAVGHPSRTWTDLMRAQVGEGWPTKVTAFRPEMAAAREVRRTLPPLRIADPTHRPTPPMRPTTAPPARPGANSSPTAPSPAC
jgi:formamidopyrimidine-DNA glycosylase